MVLKVNEGANGSNGIKKGRITDINKDVQKF
jgi:hypothetical protein